MKKYSLIFVLIYAVNIIIAQNRTVDSLKKVIEFTKSDTIKAKALSELAGEADEGEWQKYNLQLQKLINDKLPTCTAVALCNFYKKMQGNVFANLGYDLMNKGIVNKAIEYDIKALKIYEEFNCQTQLGETNNNIGFIYQAQKDFIRAEIYYKKALNNFIKENFKEGIATSYNNLGYVSKAQGKFIFAKEYYLKAIKITNEINDIEGLAGSTNNLGLVYRQLNDDETALIYYKKSLKMFEQIDNQEGLLFALNNISNIYYSQKKFNDALDYSNRAHVIGNKIGSIDGLYSITSTKYLIYKSKKMYAEALQMFELKEIYRDSINNKDNRLSILEQQIKYDQEKEKLKQEKNQLVSDSEKQKNKFVTYTVIFILLIVSGFSFWLYKKFRQVSQQKNIILHQKTEVELQKKLVDDKQKEITDSINYAKRIQNSFIASDEQFEKNVKEHFILFKPKDIVSGDFYWTNTIDNNFYLCVADSTGHGIPGAFMSLLNISLLNEALLSRNLTQTDDILNFVRKILILGLKSDDLGQGGNDGMDCTLIKLNTITKEIEISGANNPVWIVRNKELIEINVDRMPVGRSPKETLPFTASNFKLIENDTIFLFTDGYADQFGGEKGKKFMSKNLKELLLTNVHLTMKEQKTILETTFINWVCSMEQIDDVTLIGIKI